MEVIFVYILRYADTCFPKVTGFADMQVSNDQRWLVFPKNGPLRTHNDMFITHEVGEVGTHALQI